MRREAAAKVNPVRQRTQYSCMSTSMMMCLQATGTNCDEDEVNRVMGARPMQGATWEDAIACAQHYGRRVHLICPATVKQLKEFTDRGIPLMIAWNPEGRDWSHASVVFDVDDNLNVHVADPNIPDPDETVRVVPKGEFYKKWFEKWPNYLVRRPAMAVEREISSDGRQMVASSVTSSIVLQRFEKNYWAGGEVGEHRWTITRIPRKGRDDYRLEDLYRGKPLGDFPSLEDAVEALKKKTRKPVKIKRKSHTASVKLRRITPQEVRGILKKNNIPLAWTASKIVPNKPDPSAKPPKPGAVAEFVRSIHGEGWLWQRPGFRVVKGMRPGQVAVITDDSKAIPLIPKAIKSLLKTGKFHVGLPETKHTLTSPDDKFTPNEYKNGAFLVWGIQPKTSSRLALRIAGRYIREKA